VNIVKDQVTSKSSGSRTVSSTAVDGDIIFASRSSLNELTVVDNRPSPSVPNKPQRRKKAAPVVPQDTAKDHNGKGHQRPKSMVAFDTVFSERSPDPSQLSSWQSDIHLDGTSAGVSTDPRPVVSTDPRLVNGSGLTVDLVSGVRSEVRDSLSRSVDNLSGSTCSDVTNSLTVPRRVKRKAPPPPPPTLTTATRHGIVFIILS
jgi:hypothetical protein